MENEYLVTDENGCATDPSIFGEWEYSGETNSLLASFNAFKFPSSDNIRFQCNIRVCFGKCQPVNCRGYNAFGRRRRRAIGSDADEDSADEEHGVVTVGTNRTSIKSLQKRAASDKDDDSLPGQTREEIVISSNAILTFERRDEKHAGDGGDSKWWTFASGSAYPVAHQSFVFFCLRPISSLVRAARRGHLRLDDRSDHRVGHHGAPVAGRCRRGGVVLADGLPPSAKDDRTAAASARVPESAVRQSGRGVGADARLSVVSTDGTCDINII